MWEGRREATNLVRIVCRSQMRSCHCRNNEIGDVGAIQVASSRMDSSPFPGNNVV